MSRTRKRVFGRRRALTIRLYIGGGERCCGADNGGRSAALRGRQRVDEPDCAALAPTSALVGNEAERVRSLQNGDKDGRPHAERTLRVLPGEVRANSFDPKLLAAP
jgi:hypothetical protein